MKIPFPSQSSSPNASSSSSLFGNLPTPLAVLLIVLTLIVLFGLLCLLILIAKHLMTRTFPSPSLTFSNSQSQEANKNHHHFCNHSKFVLQDNSCNLSVCSAVSFRSQISIVPLQPQPISPLCRFSQEQEEEEEIANCEAYFGDDSFSCYSFPDLLMMLEEGGNEEREEIVDSTKQREQNVIIEEREPIQAIDNIQQLNQIDNIQQSNQIQQFDSSNNPNPNVVYFKDKSNEFSAFCCCWSIPRGKPKIRIIQLPPSAGFIDLALENPFLSNVIIEGAGDVWATTNVPTANKGSPSGKRPKRKFHFWISNPLEETALRKHLSPDDLPEALLREQFAALQIQERLANCGEGDGGWGDGGIKRILEHPFVPQGRKAAATLFTTWKERGDIGEENSPESAAAFRRPGTVRSFWEGALVPKDPFEVLHFLMTSNNNNNKQRE